MTNLFSLEGKVALVTGAAYGIGFSIAEAYAKAGAKIAFNCRKQEHLDKALADYKAKGIEAHGYICDVTDEEQVKAMVSDIEKKLGVIDILVNNAGIIKRIPMTEMSVEDFRQVIDIDLSEEAQRKTCSDFYRIEASDIRKVIKPRKPYCNKYAVGTLYMVAGSYGMMGAAVLAARSAMRAGVGLLTVHAPMCGFNPLQCGVPEALFETDENEYITTNIDVRRKYSALAIGPGLGTNDDTIAAVDSFLKKAAQPVVIDADALNCIAKRPILLKSIPRGSVLTPHAGEFDRLFGQHSTQEERLLKAIEVAKLYGFIIVLKGHNTMTVRYDGKVYVNSSGNAGMATAGCGDVLTGVIASLMAQGYTPDWAAVMGVYVHGLAGDMAAEEQGEMGLTASDIAANVGKAIKRIIDDKSGF